jgi:hypothetical protein
VCLCERTCVSKVGSKQGSHLGKGGVCEMSDAGTQVGAGSSAGRWGGMFGWFCNARYASSWLIKILHDTPSDK